MWSAGVEPSFGSFETEGLGTTLEGAVPPTPVALPGKNVIESQISPKRYPRRTYIDYSDEGDNAIFFIRPELMDRDRRGMARKTVAVDDLSEMEEVLLQETTDYRSLFMNPNRTGKIKGLVFVNGMLEADSHEPLKYSLVGRHMRKLWNHKDSGDVRFINRMFPKKFVPSCEDYSEIWESINVTLNSYLTENELTVLNRSSLNQFRYDTVGQAIYLAALTHYLRHRKSRSLRLFIHSLCVLSSEEIENRAHCLHMIIQWFLLNTCDSCLEKFLFLGSEPRFEYSLVDFEYDAERHLTLSNDASLTYKIFPHNDPSINHHPSSWVTYSHSAMTIRSTRATLDVEIGPRDARKTITMNVHRGMSVVRAIDGIIRTIRGRIHGHGFNVMTTWATRQHLLENQFQGLKEMISDIAMAGFYHPELLLMSRTMVFCLMFCVVPDSIFSGVEPSVGSNLHAIISRRLLTGSNSYVEFMTRPIFVALPDPHRIQEILGEIDFNHFYNP